MSDPYILYGSYASYYTAKVRSYLRKKAIPFVERLPSDPMFRNKVRPYSGSHRIPQLLAPDGTVIQDSVEIVDYLETRFSQLPAFPDSPRQRVFVHLMELLGSEGLVRLAWMHRWLFEANDSFVKMDFGRSFRPQGSDKELRRYGELIADRMKSYGLPEATSEARRALDEQYCQLLRLFEAHLVEHPYFLGGQPSAADYAVMGAMHAHLGRDPAGLRIMQDNAPRTFRWVEHMLVPEVQSPEFFSRSVEYLPDDEVPSTSLAILQFVGSTFGQPFILDTLAFNQAMEVLDPELGFKLAPADDQPLLPTEIVKYGGGYHEHKAQLHAVWIGQRARAWFHALPPDIQLFVSDWLGDGELRELVQIPTQFELRRVNNRLTIA